jgi:hypothetical protein
MLRNLLEFFPADFTGAANESVMTEIQTIKNCEILKSC